MTAPAVTDSRPPAKEKLAGFVLGILVFCSHGATGPWAVVLSAEWMADRRRCPHPARYDRIGLALGAVGAAYFVFVSVGMWGYMGGGMDPLIRAYWIAFPVWLLTRALTRWRYIRAAGAA